MIVAFVVALLSPAAASAQSPCSGDSTRQQFNALFAQVVGEWDVTIRDFDEDGRSTYEARQTRRFTWVVSDRYVEEKAFTRSADGRLTNIGLMLYSFDDSVSEVRLISFWPRSPQRWADFAGCIDQKPARVGGTITSHRPNEPVRVRRLEVVLESPTQLRWRGFARTADGREYVAEELAYVKVASSGF